MTPLSSTSTTTSTSPTVDAVRTPHARSGRGWALRRRVGVLGALLATVSAAVLMNPGSAIASTGCSGMVCISVTGSGLHVSTATVSGYFPNGGDYSLEMWSSKWYYSGAGASYAPGARPSLSRSPNSDLPNGSGVCGSVKTFGGQRVSTACVTIRG